LAKNNAGKDGTGSGLLLCLTSVECWTMINGTSSNANDAISNQCAPAVTDVIAAETLDDVITPTRAVHANFSNNTGCLGNLLQFEIAPGNTGNLVEFSCCSWKIL